MAKRLNLKNGLGFDSFGLPLDITMTCGFVQVVFYYIFTEKICASIQQ